MLHIVFLIGQFDLESILFDILLVCVFYMLLIHHKFVSPTGVFQCIDLKNNSVSYLPRIDDGQFMIPIV